MSRDTGLRRLGQLPCEPDSIAFDHQIEIVVLNPEQQVAHAAPHGKQRHVQAIRQTARLFQ
jgi:hypothetical protein